MSLSVKQVHPIIGVVDTINFQGITNGYTQLSFTNILIQFF
jgi:hypothetical protein